MSAQSVVLMHAEAHAERMGQVHASTGSDHTAKAWSDAIRRVAALRAKVGAR